MAAPTPHLILAHEGPVPLDILETFERAIAREGLRVRREARMAQRTSASMNLLSFTGVGVFLTKAYFDGLPKELDAAHAGILDTALRQLGHRLMALPARRVSTQEPLAVEDRYTSAFTVWIERDADSRFKMLIPTSLSPEGLDAALSAYLIFAQAYHEGALEPEDLEILADARPLAGVVLLAYDEESGAIQPVDPFEGRGLASR